MPKPPQRFFSVSSANPVRLVAIGLTLLVLVAIAGLVAMGKVEGPPPAEWPGGLRGGLLIWVVSAFLAFGGLFLFARIRDSLRQGDERRRMLSRAIEAAGLPQCVTGPAGEALIYNPAFRDIARPGTRLPLTALAEACASSIAGAEISRLSGLAERGRAGDALLRLRTGENWQIHAYPLETMPGHVLWQLKRAVEAPLVPSIPEIPDPAPVLEADELASLRTALGAMERRFQRFFDHAPIGVAQVDGDLRLVECNDTVLTLASMPLAEALDRPVGQLFQRDQRVAVLNRLMAVRDGADPGGPFEAPLRGGAGPVVQIFARRLDGAGDEGGGLILHLVDMTTQKNLEAQFVQSQKMQAIGQLAGGVAHDFNNLLTAMIGFCDLLLLRHKPGDASFTDIMQIKQNANRAANLVRQLLAFSRQQTLQPRILSVTDVLAELSNLLRRLIGENIELRMLHGRDLGLVKVDQGQLEQVIINLCVNARDAMAGSGGKLTVVTSNFTTAAPVIRETETMPAGDYVLVEVIDTGVGIPKENLQRIFEPFFSTKELGSGTGLGLSTVYGIVRQTGGFIFVDSAPGDGAKFSIYLPRFNDAAHPLPTGGADKGERSGPDLTGFGTVLLVEDEDAVRTFSARALRNKGYNVVEARCGEEALELLRRDDRPVVDLIITDVVMPQMDGPTLIREVRDFMPDVKVIFISGYAEERFRGTVGGDGMADFLPKPFSLKQLATKVKEVMGAG
ncbi:response regulator [Niveispirillum irakense]|uniref:response regulator n=1 Tax=Niveispirillum irakense TaxID=34011 RepID=UPI0004184F88|nr:response regulator [Niveispirillum irakense]